MNKQEYISYIKNLLPKIDQTKKYHANVVAMAISTSLEQVFNEVYLRETKNLDQYAEHFTVATKPSSSNEAGWTEYTFVTDLSGKHPINLPNKSKGILRISARSFSTVKFKPVSHQEYQQMNVTEMGYYSSVVWYLVERDRIMFYEGGLLPTDTIVDVYFIPQFYDISLTDEFNVPLGQDMKLLQYTIEALGMVMPKDLISDNSDK